MAITVTSNFDPADVPGSGLVIPAGTTNHDAVRAIIDACTAIAGTYLGEVTGGGPTPAALQVYASNITVAGTAYTDGTTIYRGSLYVKTDPLIGGSPAYSGIMLLTIDIYGVNLALLDSKAADNPALNSSKWLLGFPSTNDTQAAANLNTMINTHGGGASAQNTLSRLFMGIWADQTATASAGGTSLPIAYKFYVWAGTETIEGQECEFFVFVLRRSISGNFAGAPCIVFRVPEPGDGHWSRANRSAWLMISLMTDNVVAGGSADSNQWRGHAATPGTTVLNKAVAYSEWTPEHGFLPGVPTVDDRELFQRIQCYQIGSDQAKLQVSGYVPGLRLLRDGASIALWGTVTVGGQKYVCIVKDGTYAWCVPSI